MDIISCVVSYRNRFGDLRGLNFDHSHVIETSLLTQSVQNVICRPMYTDHHASVVTAVETRNV